MRHAALILLLLMSTAHATDTRPAKCRFLPYSDGCRAAAPAPPVIVVPVVPAEPVQAPAPAPLPPPVVIAPPPQATPQAPPVAAPAVVHPTRRHAPPRAKPRPRVKTKAIPTKPKRKRVVAMPAWWSCSKARARAAGKTRAELETLQAWGRAFGYTLTDEQSTVAKACLGIS